MKTLLIVYHERLGDIARCLPIAQHFAERKGMQVYFECKPEYHELFQYVPYAKPIANRNDWKQVWDQVLDLQIWPNRFAQFTASKKNWSDFVFEQVPDCLDRQIRLIGSAYAEPLVPEWVRSACLVFPNGYSQLHPPDERIVILQAHQLFPGVPVCVVGKRDLGCHELPSITHLIEHISAAKHVLTVNTAASILASAVRSTWHHIPDLDPQHDFVHPNQIRVGRLA